MTFYSLDQSSLDFIFYMSWFLFHLVYITVSYSLFSVQINISLFLSTPPHKVLWGGRRGGVILRQIPVKKQDSPLGCYLFLVGLVVEPRPGCVFTGW